MRIDQYESEIQRANSRFRTLKFGKPVSVVYNPLEYALDLHLKYISQFARYNAGVFLMGMNPGPWGMAQTGVPFGEVSAVRDWMKIDGTVQKPKQEHPKRPIEGLQCSRSEVSGARLWGWAKERFESPKAFAKQFFIGNYCPLCFMEESGRNLTPDKLKALDREPLLEICDEFLVKLVSMIKPKYLIGIGGFAEKRLRLLFSDKDYQIGKILHPSPASPAANRGWAEQVDLQFDKLGINIPSSVYA